MTEPDWTLLTRRINETWEAVHGARERRGQTAARFEEIEARLNRIERQLATLAWLLQPCQAKHGAPEATTHP